MARTATLVFDFDGTLADTRPHVVRAFNAQAATFGLPTIDGGDARLRDMSTRQLLKHVGFSMMRLPALVRAVRAELAHAMPEVVAFPGVSETLRALASGGTSLAIVTSNSRDNVLAFLQRQAFPEFAAIVCGSRLFGKARLIAALATRLGVPASSVIYVGDETRDIEAARKARVAAAAVTWGFNSRALLERSRPDFLLERPQELRGLI